MSNQATQPIDDGGPAFPSHGSMGEVVKEGMSLRDWFAGQVLGHLVAMPDRINLTTEEDARTALCFLL